MNGAMPSPTLTPMGASDAGSDIYEVDPGADASALFRLQRAAYTLEASIIGDERIPVLSETLADLAQSCSEWRGIKVAGRLAGALAWETESQSVIIDRLMIDPRYLRRGLARRLLTHLIDQSPMCWIHVSTGRRNRPARCLYEQSGFVHVHDVEAIEGLWISEYVRKP